MDEANARIRPTPLSALEDGDLAGRHHFLRDHFGAPGAPADNPSLVIGGAVAQPYELDLDDLRALPPHEEVTVLECAGHRRDEYAPTAGGVQWGVGAVAEARWGGVPLRHVLARARPLESAVEVVLHGADGFARSLPVAKALEREPLLAWQLDGGELPEVHGAPLRLVVPGWYATDAVKWLSRIELVTEPFTGRFQQSEYRWIEPGEEGDGQRLYELPVHSLITTPQGAARAGEQRVRGVAWSDGSPIERVEVRVDSGEWHDAELAPREHRFGLTRWSSAWEARPGWHTIDARASDGRGRVQPLQPLPNQGGYANNAVHRVAVEVAA